MPISFTLPRSVTWLLLLVAIVLLTVLTVRQVMVDSWLQYDDFVEYWAAGRLNLRGGNLQWQVTC